MCNQAVLPQVHTPHGKCKKATAQATADSKAHAQQAADAEGVPSDAELQQATRDILGALPDLYTFSVNDLLAELGTASLACFALALTRQADDYAASQRHRSPGT